MSTKPNSTISISPSFLLHALLNAPEKTLLFTDTVVYIKHRDLTPTLQAIASVRLHVSYLADHGPEYELAVELKNPPHNNAPVHIQEWHTRTEFLFDKNHPFLQTKSTNTLYHPLNPPATPTPNPLLPLYQPYTCTLSETHALLQSHIPDLPPEILSQWSNPLTISHEIEWTAYEKESSVYICYTSANQTLRSFVPPDEPLSQSLYCWRNKIILHAILPHLAAHGTLATLTATDTSHPRTLTPTPLQNLLTNTPPRNACFLTIPNLTLQLPPNLTDSAIKTLLEANGALQLSPFFPSAQSRPPRPRTPAPSPSEILKEIIQNFHHLLNIHLST